ncbi:hypothetical protein [Variovorax sp. YR216]|uniref:hypothetical protein n=1 Tax=Variovorax sp. YR216 TaxID=1882828 RepID=UPI0008992BF1|nr:hypothetical protein [Variovorax sp. YR216]SEA12951.1 hypothetical protein SAMN05444680_101613 [Variovorax sp. YR216]
MSTEPNKMNPFQKSMLARAHAITLEQLDLAKDIASTFAGASTHEQRELAAQLVQALATNYLAETLNSKMAK